LKGDEPLLFAKEIAQITLTNNVAGRLFDNVTALSYGTDKTFAATLRALLYHRLPATQSLHMAYIPLGNHMLTADLITESIRMNDGGYTYSIFLVFPQDKSYGKQLFESVRSHIGEGKKYLDTYTEQEDLHAFYIKKLNGLFYQNDHSTIIFLDELDIRRFHALQMMIPKYLPKLFADSPLSVEETALLKSLDTRSSIEYERLIEELARKLDMRSEIIRTRLKGFETVFEREKAREVAQTIKVYQHDYDMLLRKLRDTTKEIQEQQILLAGLECHINGDHQESELMEYFLCNKQLSVINVTGTAVEFIVHGYADVFDEEAFETYAGNPDSYLYDGIGDLYQDQMEHLYRAIFETGEYKLRICAAYRADMRNYIKPLQDYTFPPESRDYLPNPHIQRYGCIGGYATRFAEYMLNRDYIGAIDQAAVSARNLNFYDSAVMEAFACALAHTGIKCIEDAAGNCITPRDAIKRIDEEATTRPSPLESPTT
jgi:hypothetical protein